MRKVLLGVVAVAAIVAVVAVAVAAAAFAGYAALVPVLGPAGAAAVVAVVAALLVGLAVLIAGARGVSGRRSSPHSEGALADRLFQIARERPVLAAGAALAAGLVALKNPKLAAGLASAFMAGKAADKAADAPRRRW
jgi:uncharacterized membrane protein